MYSKQFIKTLYKQLPDEIADIVASDEIFDITASIAIASKLSPDQQKNLDFEIMILLLGLTPPDQFAITLQEKLGIDAEISGKLATEIRDQILAKVPEDALQAQEEYAQSKLKEAGPSAFAVPTSAPEIAPNDLPEILPGEVAHDVPHVESTPAAPVAPAIPTEATSTPSVAPITPPMPEVKITPSSDLPVASTPAPEAPATPKSIVEEKLSQVTAASYAPGKDPYREPIE